MHGDENAGHTAQAKRPADKPLEPGSPRKRSRGVVAGGKSGLAGVGGPGEGGRQKLRLLLTSAQSKAAYYAEHGAHDRAEQILGRSKLKECAARLSSEDIVKELQLKSRTDLFDRAVDAAVAPGYYQEGSSEHTAWGTEVMYFDKMLLRAADKVYDQHLRTRLALVEKDFNTMIYNAVIYNNSAHLVNMEARKLLREGRKVFRKAELTGDRPCRECGGDELYVENPVQICDYCCSGMHVSCEASKAANESTGRQRPAEQGCHPLRRLPHGEGVDSAWFCSDECQASFAKLAQLFQLDEEQAQQVSDYAAWCRGEQDSGEEGEEGGSTRETALSFCMEEMVVIARQGNEPLTPGVTLRPRTEEQKRAARRWPRQPLVLWHVPKHMPVWGSAIEYKAVDKDFDELAYLYAHVDAARRPRFVEQLEWSRRYLHRDVPVPAPTQADAGHGSATDCSVAPGPSPAAGGVGVAAEEMEEEETEEDVGGDIEPEAQARCGVEEEQVAEGAACVSSKHAVRGEEAVPCQDADVQEHAHTRGACGEVQEDTDMQESSAGGREGGAAQPAGSMASKGLGKVRGLTRPGSKLPAVGSASAAREDAEAQDPEAQNACGAEEPAKPVEEPAKPAVYLEEPAVHADNTCTVRVECRTSSNSAAVSARVPCAVAAGEEEAAEAHGPSASPRAGLAPGQECSAVCAEAGLALLQAEGPIGRPGAEGATAEGMEEEGMEEEAVVEEAVVDEAAVLAPDWGPEGGQEASGLGVEGAAGACAEQGGGAMVLDDHVVDVNVAGAGADERGEGGEEMGPGLSLPQTVQRIVEEGSCLWRDPATGCYEVTDGTLFQARFNALRRRKHQGDNASARAFSAMHRHFTLLSGDGWGRTGSKFCPKARAAAAPALPKPSGSQEGSGGAGALTSAGACASAARQNSLTSNTGSNTNVASARRAPPCLGPGSWRIAADVRLLRVPGGADGGGRGGSGEGRKEGGEAEKEGGEGGEARHGVAVEDDEDEVIITGESVDGDLQRQIALRRERAAGRGEEAWRHAVPFTLEEFRRATEIFRSVAGREPTLDKPSVWARTAMCMGLSYQEYMAKRAAFLYLRPFSDVEMQTLKQYTAQIKEQNADITAPEVLRHLADSLGVPCEVFARRQQLWTRMVQRRREEEERKKQQQQQQQQQHRDTREREHAHAQSQRLQQVRQDAQRFLRHEQERQHREQQQQQEAGGSSVAAAGRGTAQQPAAAQLSPVRMYIYIYIYIYVYVYT